MRENRIVIAVIGLLVIFGLGSGAFVLATGLTLWQQSREVAKGPSPVVKLQTELQTARDELQRALTILGDVFGHPVEPSELQTVPVTITAYSSTVDQCDSTPYIAANNKPVRVGTLAVSPDLKKEFGIEFGQRVLIPGYGVFEVCDLMNPRWQRRVDIWESDRQAARMFGKRQGMLIWLPLPDQEEIITVARND